MDLCQCNDQEYIDKVVKNPTVFLHNFFVFLAGAQEWHQVYMQKVELLPSECGFASEATSTLLLTSPGLEVYSAFVLFYTFFRSSKFPLSLSELLWHFWPFTGPQSLFQFGGKLHCKKSLLHQPSRLDQLLPPFILNVSFLKCELLSLVPYAEHVVLHMLEHLMAK